MNQFAFIAALVFAAPPAAAQPATSNDQVRSPEQRGPAGSTPAPITGVFCIEEMTATFCNIVAGPNSGGYGARNGSRSGPGSRPTAVPPCPADPPLQHFV